MTALAHSIRRHDPGAADRVRRWRERRRRGEQARPLERQALGTREGDYRDPGPAIREGEPFADDFDWTESEWTRRLAGARFVDVAVARF